MSSRAARSYSAFIIQPSGAAECDGAVRRDGDGGGMAMVDVFGDAVEDEDVVVHGEPKRTPKRKAGTHGGGW